MTIYRTEDGRRVRGSEGKEPVMTTYRAGERDCTLVRSDDGDWTLYAPDDTDEQIADGEATPLISGHAEWMEEHEVWDGPHGGDYAVANIKTAFSLDDLLIDLRTFEETYGPDDLENALKANGIDMFELPSFGGDRPSKTADVWSWDESRLLVGPGPFSEWRIVPR
jgi:hypothetical protein